jgi:3-hydroxyisobutyrate dehydrogenase-like beta-hydroxyacid dehydrogenase
MSSEEKKLGFIGLGQMGGPMAANLARAGHDLTVFDLRPQAVADVVAEGAKAAVSVEELVASVDVVFTSLPSQGVVERVFTEEGGILASARPGLIYVDLSTSGPLLLRRLYEIGATREVRVLDCPVSGSHRGAVDGTLVLMVGGDEDAFAQVEHVLSDIGRSIFYTGQVGNGNVCKLAHNSISAVMGQALMESFVMAVKAGVEPRMIWEIVRRGTVGRMSTLHSGLPEGVLRGDFQKGGKTYQHYQELGLALELADSVRSPMVLASLSYARHVQMMNRGWAHDSWVGSELRLCEEAAGDEVQFRVNDLTAEDVGPPKGVKW